MNAYNRLPTWLLWCYAKYYRRTGDYEHLRSMLAVLRRRSGWPSLYVSRMLWQRAMGDVIGVRQAEEIQEIWPKLDLYWRYRASLLLLESPVGDAALDGVMLQSVQPFWAQAPTLAILAEQRGVRVGEDVRRMARIGAHQQQKQQRLILRMQQADRVFVVGNAADDRIKNREQDIDSSDEVVRFNCYQNPGQETVGRGLRCTVWGCSPAFIRQDAWRRSLADKTVPGVMLLSGPDMYYGLQDWRPLLQACEQGMDIVTLPLGVWRGLVRDLAAPPSAGILTLAWLRQLRPAASVQWTGFGGDVAGTVRYHHTLPRHRAGKRHNWLAERRVLLSWIE